MSFVKCACAAVVLLSLTSVAGMAEVRLPKMISDHAVLQRERPLHLWGWATPGAHVTASFHDQNVAMDVDSIGKWSVFLQPEKAGGPFVLTIAGDGAAKTVSDLLVGDVWFASGQSNMEMPLGGFQPNAPLKDGDKEIAAAQNPKLRLLRVDHKGWDFPLNDISGGTWTECTPESAKNFSAVAYFFGREIAVKENVAVGLIDSSWGGTPADPWVSLDTLASDPALLTAFASRAAFANLLTDTDSRIAEEKREDAEARAAGKPVPTHPWHPGEISWTPAALYNAMVAPFTPMTLKGFLWYQGETNSSQDRAPYYDTLLAALIADWRGHFAQGTLPFLYVQISSFNSPGEDWGLLREQQRRALSVANTAMVVTLDVGTPNNVHPPDKQTVGARLALAAEALAYDQPVAYRGPEFREATRETMKDGSGAMRVWFNHGEGLTFRGKPVTGFEVAGTDHKFVPAQAHIEGSTVLVSADAVKHPAYVRYGWAGVVPDSLYNAASLPTSTFSSEWKLVH